MTYFSGGLETGWLGLVQGLVDGKLEPETINILGVLGNEEKNREDRLKIILTMSPFSETYGQRDKEYDRIARLHKMILNFCGNEAHLWLNLVCAKMKNHARMCSPAFFAGSFLAFLEFGVRLDQTLEKDYFLFQETLLAMLFEVSGKANLFRKLDIVENRNFASRFNSAVGRFVHPKFQDKKKSEKRLKEIRDAIKLIEGWHILSNQLTELALLFLSRVLHALADQGNVLILLPQVIEGFLFEDELEHQIPMEEVTGDAGTLSVDPADDLSVLRDDSGDYPTSTA